MAWVTWQLSSSLGLSWLALSLVLVTVFKKISFKKKKKKADHAWAWPASSSLGSSWLMSSLVLVTVFKKISFKKKKKQKKKKQKCRPWLAHWGHRRSSHHSIRWLLCLKSSECSKKTVKKKKEKVLAMLMHGQCCRRWCGHSSC